MTNRRADQQLAKGAGFTNEEWISGLVEAQIKTAAMLFAVQARSTGASLDRPVNYLGELSRKSPYPAASVIYDAICEQLAVAYQADDLPEGRN